MADDPPPDAFHAHEVLHTASIVAKLFEDQIVDHRYTRAHPKIRDAAERLSAALHDFYQLVGQQTCP